MDAPHWTSSDIPLEKPSPARMYDYFLGGFHNFEIDRQVAIATSSLYPDISLVMQANRAFLRRAIKFLSGQGITQFLDIGSGIPTVGNVHTVVHDLNPTARVVYVDVDPIAVCHTELILRDVPYVRVIQADVRQPDRILSHPMVQQMLDFQQPLAILLVAVLHYVPNDAEADHVVRVLCDSLSPGSYVAISHETYEHIPPDVMARLEALYAQTTTPGKARSREQIAVFFAGLDLVEPGLVYVPRWQPEDATDLFLDQPERSINFAGIGRKP